MVTVISEVSHRDSFGRIGSIEETHFGRLLGVDSSQETEVVVGIVKDSFVDLQCRGLIQMSDGGAGGGDSAGDGSTDIEIISEVLLHDLRQQERE